LKTKTTEDKMTKLKWGVDLGGTKIEGIVLDHNNNTLWRERIATEATLGYEHILNQIKKLIDKGITEVNEMPKKVGFSTPGVLDPSSERLKNSNTACLNGQFLAQDLSKILQTDVVTANDANCFALAETQIGIVPEIAPNAKVVFGVIMGTGVGGGLVVNGQAIYGKHGIGGEWGHNILEENGTPCYCGKHGCVEKVLSGPALQLYYGSLSGSDRSLKEIYNYHLNGTDPYASQTIYRLLEYFGKGMASLINVIDPDIIVIGGGVGNVDLLYTEGIERIKKYIFNKGIVETPIVKPLLGDSAGVYGAAFL
jgi:fructokinase